MRGKLVAAAAVVAALGFALVGGAAVTGSQAKKKIQAVPQVWQAQWPMIKVLDQRYERGLFSSTHTLSLQVGCDTATGSGASLALTVKQHIQHGPLPGFRGVGAATIDTELVLPEAARKQLAALIGQQQPFSAHTKVGFSGATQTHFAMPAFNMSGAQGEQLSFQGLSGDIGDDGASLRYDLSMPGFGIAVRNERMAMDVKMAGMHVHGDLRGGGSTWLRPGQSEGELGAIEISVAAPTSQTTPPFRFALRQLKFTSANTLDGQLLNGVARLGGQGQINDVKLDKIELQASVKRMHAPSYERLMQHVMDTGAAACGLKQGISPQVVLAEMQKDLMALLPYNPEYALDKLAVESGGQRGEVSYAVGVSGVTPEEAAMPLPVLAMTRGQLRGQARLPVAWIKAAVARFGGAGAEGDPAAQAEMVNVMLTKMTGDGYIVREDDTLTTEFRLDKGQMLVNGKPLGPRPQAE